MFEQGDRCHPPVSRLANHYYDPNCNRLGHDQERYELSLCQQNHQQINLQQRVYRYGYKMDDGTLALPFDPPALFLESQNPRPNHISLQQYQVKEH